MAPGVRLGAYEVLARGSAGGMGKSTWRADTKLNRDIALKILPDLSRMILNGGNPGLVDAEQADDDEWRSHMSAAMLEPEYSGIRSDRSLSAARRPLEPAVKTIRLAISLFILVLIAVSAAGWVWTGLRQTASQSAGSDVVIGICILAGVVGLIALWRARPEEQRRGHT